MTLVYQKYKNDPYYKNKTPRNVHFMIEQYLQEIIMNSDDFKVNAIRHGAPKKIAKQIIQLLERKYGVVLTYDELTEEEARL